MKKVWLSVILLMILMTPVRATSYAPVTFEGDGVRVIVILTANTPWSSPFSEHVSVNLTVEPLADGVIQTNISSVVIGVNHRTTPGSGFLLMAVDSKQLSPPVTGTTAATFSGTFTLSGNTAGDDCYFAISVAGVYVNGSGTYHYETTSNESLIGPFIVSATIGTPQVLVGLVFTLVFIAVIVLGAIGVRRSRAPPKKPYRLLEE